MPTMFSRTVEIGATITSSWSWKPFDPFGSSIPMIRNRMPLNSTCWPTGSTPFPKSLSMTVDADHRHLGPGADVLLVQPPTPGSPLTLRIWAKTGSAPRKLDSEYVVPCQVTVPDVL